MPSTELQGYVDVWRSAVADFIALVESLPETAWSTPTDLPGWDVFACLAHTTHLEALLAGVPHEDVEIGELAHVRGSMGTFTEQGVVARRGRSPQDLIAELRDATARRDAELAAEPPSDPDAPAPGLFGLIGWSTRTLLRNRPLDVWMHEQDIRCAVGKPGDLDGPGARHATDYLLEAMPVVFAKRAKAGPGESLVIDVTGHDPRAWLVGEDGRAAAVAPPADPTVHLAMDREDFTRLAGGRRTPHAAAVTIRGDDALARRILDTMAVTP